MNRRYRAAAKPGCGLRALSLGPVRLYNLAALGRGRPLGGALVNPERPLGFVHGYKGGLVG